MKYTSLIVVLLLGLGIFIGGNYVCLTGWPGNPGIKPDLIKLPAGFKISVYADKLPGARSMTLGERGTLFIGTRSEGTVYAVRDTDGDFKSDRMYIIASGLSMPNGVAFRNGSLYVAEIHRVLRYDDIEKKLANPPKPALINDSFPRDRHHGWKYIAFGPDGKLYVPVGAPCNICKSADERYASILRMNPDGSGLEIVAKGVRNTVGFDWDPDSGDLWFTDNGRDWMGNDLPPDELNRLRHKGEHFGYPYCHGAGIADPEYGVTKKCGEFSGPETALGAHVASLGMKFYNGAQFPPRYRNRIFIAEHGSWNRNPPSGYRITMVTPKNGGAVSYTVFAKGWLRGARAWGRPVDLLILPDGSMLVSDDLSGTIYRIHYKG